MIWIYRFSDSLTAIELENLVRIHGSVTIDVKSR